MPDRKTIVSPFRGIRYHLPGGSDLSHLVAPPYDVISETMQAQLYARHQHNFVRVELPENSPSEGEPADRYARAAASLRKWVSGGVLTREESPALYLFEQEFQLAGRAWRRRGVFGLVRLPEEGESHVLSHEGTLPGPKADRLRLMRSCQAMTSPIMLMHEDPGAELIRLLHQVSGDPDATAEDCQGVAHRLWILRDAGMIEAICAAIGPGPLFIADGHHRFETALSYREEMRQAFPEATAKAGFNYALALITSVKDAALRILPTHRLVSGLDEASKERIKERMREYFEVHRWPLPDPAGLGSQPWLEGLAPDRHVFGAYYGDAYYYVLIARDEILPSSRSVVEALDVSILHRHLIDPVISIPGTAADEDARISHDSDALEVARRGARLTYVIDEHQAVAAVERGDYDLAFFLRPTRVSDVLAAARAGERMPGKSTYFYPKAPAGVVISDASAQPI